jgi:hypothetical protein
MALTSRTVLKFDEYILSVAEGWQFMLQIVERSKNVSTDLFIAFPPFENDRETFLNLLEDTARVSSVKDRQKLLRQQFKLAKNSNQEHEDYEEDTPLDGLTDWFEQIFLLATDLGLNDVLNAKLFEEDSNANHDDDVKRIFELMRGTQQTLLGVSLINHISDAILARLLAYSRFDQTLYNIDAYE